MGRKKNNRIYFGQDVENAIIRYNGAEDYREKNKIYEREIHYAFDKLAENIINTFKFSYFDYPLESVKDETVSFLVIKLPKFDHTRGFKAFSYFSTVAKNYLIQNNNSNYKRLKTHLSIDNFENDLKSEQKNQDAIDLMKKTIRDLETEIPDLFVFSQDLKIAYAIVELLKDSHNIENHNKKSLYILIREMTGVKTIYITKVLNILKGSFKNIQEDFKMGN